MEKQELETLMTKEAAIDFGLDVNDLIKVKKKDGTYYVYKEKVSEEDYKKFMQEEWRLRKRRQRDFEYLKNEGMSLLSLDKSLEDINFEVKSDEDLEEIAVTRLMLEVLQDEINNLPKEDKRLMNFIFHTDLTQRQLADIFGVSVWKINTDIKKNKKILRDHLTK
ncbi:sigma-70 family RNA polymerase sigma factor [Peptoniphilus obesi]|uniref:sigma-70 family RNA polymerase sigma factor n=1 Tax=Peptoniphilus obesi TaxID=1472765 RepID=UPI0004B7803B|nr:sigma-70 family RNA polymerase sigma factor [Peptoniphilus obesi]